MAKQTDIPAMLIAKFHINRFPGMSSKMGAILGCILGQSWTNPELIELTVTSDGMLLGRQSNDCGFNEFLGSESDLQSNWERLLNAVANSSTGLTKDERTMMEALYQSAVQH
jgi:hypothetical protein